MDRLLDHWLWPFCGGALIAGVCIGAVWILRKLAGRTR